MVVKVGGGGRDAGRELTTLLERSGGVLVHTPIASGCIPYHHPANMTVGGSKGTLCGNYAMEHADLLVAIGTRAVCQSDCSRTGYPRVKKVINLNACLEDALHYHNTLALVGDVKRSLRKLNQALGEQHCQNRRGRRIAVNKKGSGRYSNPNGFVIQYYWMSIGVLPVLTQPAAIMQATALGEKQRRRVLL